MTAWPSAATTCWPPASHGAGPGRAGAVPGRYPRRNSARTLILRQQEQKLGKGTIGIISAGTSDIPVAEEAAVTAEIMGNRVLRLFDVGVAGLHRLLARTVTNCARPACWWSCAGMEGALPSVVGGLVGVPVIAVPTSVGYGAAFGGIAALLGMINSCASQRLGGQH